MGIQLQIEPAVSSIVKRTLSVREVWSSMAPTARHRCDVSSELCSPGAKPQRWAPPLVTRFGVIPVPRVYNEDLIFAKPRRLAPPLVTRFGVIPRV